MSYEPATPVHSSLKCDSLKIAVTPDGFIKGAAIEMPRGIRINGVSPTVISESMENYSPYFRGYEPVSAACAALAYSKSVEPRLISRCLLINLG
jgi:hypothetical protein